MNKTELQSEAERLYELSRQLPGSNDFSFPSWLLTLWEPEKWDDDAPSVFDNKERARAALDNATHCCSVFADTEFNGLVEKIQNGIYEMVAGTNRFSFEFQTAPVA